VGRINKRSKQKKKREAGTRHAGLSEAAIERQVTELVSPILSADGLELVMAEVRRESGGRILRLYIDKPGGVTLDDCVAVTREIGDLLDVSLESIGPHRMEVSSPGADRPLVKPEDFTRFAGENVHIRLRKPIDERKNIRGILSAATADGIFIDADQQRLEIAFNNISIARLVPTPPPKNRRGDGRNG